MCNSIEVRGAYKSYEDGGDNFVLNGLNMRVKSGQIYSLIGASGCGKTTLLQCILGMKTLDSGSISVLGHAVTDTKVNKVSHLIGYMPQQTELVPELTIKETSEYFGNIFQMDREVLKSRFKMIHELLELPCADRKIEELSGGQMRRVSLAVAIIHDPRILVLDEPTVGLDSILRDKIWNFLMFTTTTTNLSVVITTHYISEAMQSNCVGLMRDGRLLAEDTPNNIISYYGTPTLDEAFLKLCLMEKNGNELQFVPQIEDIGSEKEITETQKVEVESIAKRKTFNKRTMSALLRKEYLRIKRQPAELIFIVIYPIMQVLLFGYSIGGFPLGLKLGVVNHEVADYSQCSLHLQNQSSNIQFASCDLLAQITDDVAIKVFYNSYDEAYRDAKRNEIIGFVEISPHFTDIMLRSKVEEKEEEHLGEYGIDIHMDQTDLQLTSFLQFRLYKAYEIFNKKLLGRCGLNENLENIPMKFEKPIYGSFMSDFKNSMAPATIMQIAYFASVAFTSFSIAQSRRGGFWNRTLLAGVTPLEILVVQILWSFLVVFISVTETVVVAFYIIDITIIGNGLTLIIILFMACTAGSFCGILLSCATDDIKFVSMITLASGQVISNLSGAVWPLEGQYWLVRYFSYLLPITLPSISMRDVMMRGYDIFDESVVIGMVVLLLWIGGTLFASICVMRKRKFSESSM